MALRSLILALCLALPMSAGMSVAVCEAMAGASTSCQEAPDCKRFGMPEANVVPGAPADSSCCQVSAAQPPRTQLNAPVPFAFPPLPDRESFDIDIARAPQVALIHPAENSAPLYRQALLCVFLI